MILVISHIGHARRSIPKNKGGNWIIFSFGQERTLGILQPITLTSVIDNSDFTPPVAF